MLLQQRFGDARIISNGGIVGSANMGTAVPDAATVDTYGAVTELISAASNTMESWRIAVCVCATLNPSATVGHMALDILVGGATDDVLIKSLLVGGAFHGGWRCYEFPLRVPSGVRVAAQLAAGAAQTTEARVLVNLYGDCPPPMRVGRKVTTYGTKVNDARGAAITPSQSGAAASVTEMTASTSEDHWWFVPGFQVETDTTISTATGINVGIGVGAATEERIGTWWFSKNASEAQAGPMPTQGAERRVPAGSRLTLLCSNGATNDTAHGGHIYAIS